MKSNLVTSQASRVCARRGCTHPCYKTKQGSLCYSYCSHLCGQLDATNSEYFTFLPVYQDDVDFHQVCAQLNKENHDLTNGTAAVFRIMAPHSMLQRYASSIKKYGGNSRRIICYIDQQGNDVLRNKASTKCFPEVILKAVPEKLPDSIAQYEQQEDWHIAIVCSVPSIHAAPSKTTMLLPRFLVYYHK